MVAVAFGSYATSLFVGEDAAGWWDNVFTSAIVVAMAAINLVGSRVVDRAQSLIVVVLLAVFAVFIAVTHRRHRPRPARVQRLPAGLGHHRERRAHVLRLPRLQRDHLRGRRPARPGARAAEGDVRRARRDDASSTSSSRSASSARSRSTRSIGYGETAIAEAARPALGDAGFTMVSIAALLATASSVNATLYASGGLTRMLAGDGQFPPFFARETRFGPHAGHADHGRDRARGLESRRPLGDRIGRKRLLARDLPARRGLRRSACGPRRALWRSSCSTAIAATAVVLVFFAVDTLRNAPETFAAIVGITALSVVLWTSSGSARAGRCARSRAG